MITSGTGPTGRRKLGQHTQAWGDQHDVSLYLDRCQVDTPDALVATVWRLVHELRPEVGKVVDFGAGDGRFARHGRFQSYTGYEVDAARAGQQPLPENACLKHCCAFSDVVADADLCVGNPPFVRNQDLPDGWRQEAATVLSSRTGVVVSGLANAWQYFFLLALASTAPNGLCALIVPYEWVSRPSALALRQHIAAHGWDVHVHRLADTTFNRVLTTSCITVVDKAGSAGCWRYYDHGPTGVFAPLSSPSGAEAGVLPYMRRSDLKPGNPRAVRGLSPGTQLVFTLTEGERAHFGLEAGRDVVPCVTSLRPLPPGKTVLDGPAFRSYYVDAARRCWLVRVDQPLSPSLAAYFEAADEASRNTSTCQERQQRGRPWWQFNMPPVPSALMSMSFKGPFPKSVRNDVGARAVGSVCNVHGLSSAEADWVAGGLGGLDIRSRVVAHSNNLRKIEISQLNGLLADTFGSAQRSFHQENGCRPVTWTGEA